MSIEDFNKVVDLYPTKRIVIYSSETNQPYFNGRFEGSSYNPEEASENTVCIYHDQSDDHFSWIQNLQRYYRSIMTYKGHNFCFKCLGWVQGCKINTHRCIYDFRCNDCGNYKTGNSPAALMRHRDQLMHGTEECQKCGLELPANECIEKHKSWCKRPKLTWTKCLSCTTKYNVNWDHRCYHKWCKRHYPDGEDHRCFICKDKFRREMDDSDGEIRSELDDTEVILFKTGEHREPLKHQEKSLKLDIESRHYAYDMESMLISTPQPNGTTSDVHEVVLIIARQLYTDFNDENSFHVFHAIGSFLKFAMSKKRSYFWAHNAQGYDSGLLFSYVSHVSTLYKPTNIIMRGEKILQFCIKTTKFRDSMCHLTSALDSLPKMLGFSGDWKKGVFPHKFNVPENQQYVGPFPERSFYEPDEMKENRKQEFEKWFIQEQLNY